MKVKMGKQNNKEAVRNLVESEAVNDKGLDEIEVWSRLRTLLRAGRKCKSTRGGKKLRNIWKRRQWVAQELDRVDTSGFEMIEWSEQYLYIGHSQWEILEY